MSLAYNSLVYESFTQSENYETSSCSSQENSEVQGRSDIVGLESTDIKLNSLERRIGLAKAIKLYKRNIFQNSNEYNTFERLAVIYINRNQIEKEVCVSKKAIAFYEHAVYAEHLESMLPMLNQFTKRLKAAKSILASQRNE